MIKYLKRGYTRCQVDMNILTKQEVENLTLDELVRRMDQILALYCPCEISEQVHINWVYSIMDTVMAKQLDENTQRKLAYKVFGMLLQIKYTYQSVQPREQLPIDDKFVHEQLLNAESRQWLRISTRIVFEYFMGILYMLGKKQELSGKSRIRKVVNWLKEPDNEFNYFAITVARGKKYSRYKRDPEIHATTKIAKDVLTLSVEPIDWSELNFFHIITNQMQDVVSIANGEKHPGVMRLFSDEFNDYEWDDLLKTGNNGDIAAKIDEMMKD